MLSGVVGSAIGRDSIQPGSGAVPDVGGEALLIPIGGIWELVRLTYLDCRHDWIFC